MRYLFGDYTLDTQRYELRRAEQRIALEPKAFDLLLYLVEHRDRVVGRDELLDQVWPEQFISDHSLTARLQAVRQVLQDDAREPRFIETIHGRGCSAAPISIASSIARWAPRDSVCFGKLRTRWTS